MVIAVKMIYRLLCVFVTVVHNYNVNIKQYTIIIYNYLRTSIKDRYNVHKPK